MNNNCNEYIFNNIVIPQPGAPSSPPHDPIYASTRVKNKFYINRVKEKVV